MTFLYATAAELETVIENAKAFAHKIISVFSRPGADGRYLITTLKQGDFR